MNFDSLFVYQYLLECLPCTTLFRLGTATLPLLQCLQYPLGFFWQGPFHTTSKAPAQVILSKSGGHSQEGVGLLQGSLLHAKELSYFWAEFSS